MIRQTHSKSSRSGRLAVATVVVIALSTSCSSKKSRDQPKDIPTLPGSIARVIAIERAADEKAPTIAVRSHGATNFAPVGDGGSIAAGGTVRTDARTRAHLELDDGSVVVLNHDTEVTFAATTPRHLVVAAGEVVADIKPVAGANAVFETPNGRLAVMATRFAVAVATDFTSVRVTRGLVRLESGADSVEVHPGEEGVAVKDSKPTVTPTGHLADSVAWAELGVVYPEAEESLAGLGELRAFRPGEKRDKDWPLSIRSHRVTVRIAGNIARTEIEESFRNDSEHELEGVYKFPLPADANIDRLALDVAGGFEEGAFIDKARAAKIWRGVINKATPKSERDNQEIIWVAGPWRDPALLEWQRGGRFELRVFPIPARGQRTIKIAYTQTLRPHGDRRRYIYPLAHAKDDSNAVEQFDVDVRVSGADPAIPVRYSGYELEAAQSDAATSLTYSQARFVPKGNLVVDYALPGSDKELRAWTFRGDVAVAPGKTGSGKIGPDRKVVAAQKRIAADPRPFVLFSLRPKLPRWTEAHPRDYLIVVDSSQSMFGERYTRARRLAAAMVTEMDRRDRFFVLACDLGCRQLGEGPAHPSARSAGEVATWLDAIEPAGSTALLPTLTTAADTLAANSSDDRQRFIVYIGDGMASTGQRHVAAVASAVTALAAKSAATLTTVGIGVDADAAMLATIARAGGGHYIPWVPGERASAAALSVLETSYGVTLRTPSVELPRGLSDLAPDALPTLRAGDELLIAARFAGKVSGDIVLKGSVGGKPYENRFPITLEAATAMGNAFVPRSWAALTIDRLELSGRAADRIEIIALSKAFALLSRHTSLLVLESDAMFKAFGIDRAQPTVRWTGEESAVVVEADGEIGYGSGGNHRIGPSAGRGAGKAMTNKSGSVAPKVTIGKANATGSLDKEIIRRYIRRHLGRIKHCYEKQLLVKPGLKGTVVVRFHISPAGTVLNVKADGFDNAVTSCVATAIKRITFPKPRDGGMVQVRYPFAFNVDKNPKRPIWGSPPPQRVIHRLGSFSAYQGVSPAITKAVADFEAALAKEPNSRERHRNLVQALSYAGELDRAYLIATKWLERDRLDAEALIYMADILGRQGDRQRALRLLSGVVDVEPDSVKLHRRLAAAYQRIGATERACSHQVALAELSLEKTEIVGAALRCQRALDDGGATHLLQAVASDKLRKQADKLAARAAKVEAVRGQLLMKATWNGSVDLDLTVITPQGTRLSWMGGRTSVRADEATAIGHENLALTGISRGKYLIEVSRTDPDDRIPVKGEIKVVLLEETRTLPFELTDARSVVSAIQVRYEERKGGRGTGFGGR